MATVYGNPLDLAGVYFLFRGKRIVYVGQSRDIVGRVHAHKRSKARGLEKDFDGVMYVKISGEHQRLCAERIFIRVLKPEYNNQCKEPGVGRPRAFSRPATPWDWLKARQYFEHGVSGDTLKPGHQPDLFSHSDCS